MGDKFRIQVSRALQHDMGQCTLDSHEFDYTHLSISSSDGVLVDKKVRIGGRRAKDEGGTVPAPFCSLDEH